MCCQSILVRSSSRADALEVCVEDASTSAKAAPAAVPAFPDALAQASDDFQSPLARWLGEPVTFELTGAADDTCAWHSVPVRKPVGEPNLGSSALQLTCAASPPPPAPELSFAMVPVFVGATNMQAYSCFGPLPAAAPWPVAFPPACGWDQSASVSTRTSSACSGGADTGSDTGEMVSSRSTGVKLSASAARRRRRQKAAAYAAAAAAAGLGDADMASHGFLQAEHWQRSASSFSQRRCAELLDRLAVGGESLTGALEELRGSVPHLSLDVAGCRVVQEALRVAEPSAAASLASELRGKVWQTIDSPYGNYVVQKMIELLPASLVSFIAEELRGYGVEVARHRFGCRALCRLLEHAGSVATTVALVDEALPFLADLCADEYGHHVVECMLEHGSETQVAAVADGILSNLPRFAFDRHATYVVKAVLARGSLGASRKIAEALAGDEGLLVALAAHQYGHHVVSALLRVPGDVRIAARDALRRCDAQLRSTKYGCRLLDEIEQHQNPAECM